MLLNYNHTPNKNFKDNLVKIKRQYNYSNSKRYDTTIQIGNDNNKSRADIQVDNPLTGSFKVEGGKAFTKGRNDENFTQLATVNDIPTPTLNVVRLFGGLPYDQLPLIVTKEMCGLDPSEDFPRGIYLIDFTDKVNGVNWSNVSILINSRTFNTEYATIRDYNAIDQGTIYFTGEQFEITRNPNNVTAIQTIAYIPLER